MRKCAEFREVSRVDGSTSRRCAKFEDVSDDSTDVLVSGENKTGSIVPEVISGLKGIANIKADQLIGPAVGAGGTMLTLLLIRKFIAPKVGASSLTGWMDAPLNKFAPILSALGGIALSVAAKWWKGKSVMQSGVISSIITGGVIQAYEMASSARVFGALVAAPTYGLVASPVMGLVASPVGYLPEISESANLPVGIGPLDVGAFGRA
jgi:hypothetical protein